MAEFVKSFVVFAHFQMRQFMHRNHLQKSCGRIFEQRRDFNVSLGFEFAALNTRGGGVQTQGMLNDLQFTVKRHLVDGVGLAQKFILQIHDEGVQSAIGSNAMGLRVPCH